MKRLASLAAVGLLIAAAPAVAATQIADGGFESQGAGVGTFCYFGACPSGPWTGTSGLQDDANGAWPGIDSPDGSKYGFVQGGGSLEQTFTSLDTGSFTLSWIHAGRPNTACGGCFGNQTYEVFLNATSLGTYSTTTAQLFSAQSTNAFALVANQNYTLRFQGLNPRGGDNTSYIDAVSLSGGGAVPEPATWALMIGGFGMAGAMLRRRRTVAA